jgi:hypothetical protein
MTFPVKHLPRTPFIREPGIVHVHDGPIFREEIKGEGHIPLELTAKSPQVRSYGAKGADFFIFRNKIIDDFFVGLV